MPRFVSIVALVCIAFTALALAVPLPPPGALLGILSWEAPNVQAPTNVLVAQWALQNSSLPVSGSDDQNSIFGEGWGLLSHFDHQEQVLFLVQATSQTMYEGPYLLFAYDVSQTSPTLRYNCTLPFNHYPGFGAFHSFHGSLFLELQRASGGNSDLWQITPLTCKARIVSGPQGIPQSVPFAGRPHASVSRVVTPTQNRFYLSYPTPACQSLVSIDLTDVDEKTPVDWVSTPIPPSAAPTSYRLATLFYDPKTNFLVLYVGYSSIWDLYEVQYSESTAKFYHLMSNTDRPGTFSPIGLVSGPEDSIPAILAASDFSQVSLYDLKGQPLWTVSYSSATSLLKPGSWSSAGGGSPAFYNPGWNTTFTL